MVRILIMFLLALAVRTSSAGETIVCLGDSLTAGRGLSQEEAYPALVEQLAHQDHHDWTLINAGISGDTSADGLHRLAWVLKVKPDLIFVALGANDGLRGMPVAQTTSNLEGIVDACTKASVRVALAGMKLPKNYGAEYRAAFAAIFAPIAAGRHLAFMPFLLQDVGGIPSLNQADGIHPTLAGQRIIATHVYAFLQSALQAQTPASGATK
jgi:acyl-CoA thioesterase-1